MEIIKLSKLPSESSYKKEMTSINATRWLDLSSLNESNYQKKDVLIPAGLTTLQHFLPTAFTRTHLLTHSLTHSLTHLLTYSLTHSLTPLPNTEPTYLCARSTNWQKHEHITEVPFNVTFQPGVIRESDQLYCSLILYFFLFILFLLASSWLLPYVISLICYYLRLLLLTYSLIHLLTHSLTHAVTKKP